jgi:hypothetical protein
MIEQTEGLLPAAERGLGQETLAQRERVPQGLVR